VKFQQEDYDFAFQMTTAGNSEHAGEFYSGSKRMFGKLRTAFKIRCMQVDSIVRHMDSSPYPVLVCGDFNDTPWSYSYHQFGKRLKDSQVHSGRGRGNTFVLNRLLRFRIDYLFYPSFWGNYRHTVLRVHASDHYPVCCDLKPSLQTDSRQ
jgi:endonuclease/exonuclease/phosphatase (EEP) superfamily protein YafD